jgi:predicted cupin superfamily sugar epimerase
MIENGIQLGVSARAVVERLGLEPHPEGGWYKETWRGHGNNEGERGTGTAILFLLDAGERSRWHRVDATEIWLYHAGATLRLFTAPSEEGKGATEHRLGPDVMAGDEVQHVISPGDWQSAEAVGGWCLVSCVVVPAFEFSGFELASEGWQPGDGAL